MNRESWVVGVAKWSTAEIGCHLLLARELAYISREEFDELDDGYRRIGQMLTRLSQALARE